LITIHR